MEQVATIRGIARYPVKSMRGHWLQSVSLTYQGIPEDRRYAFVQAGSRRAFPWLTARECPDLLRYRPLLEQAEKGAAACTVLTPDGARLPVLGDQLRRELETRTGRSLFLLQDHRGSQDVAQVSLLAAATARHVAEQAGVAADPARFRPNIYLDTGDEPFVEDRWIGRVLRIGAVVRIAVTEADQRCAIVGLDPETGASNPHVLAAVTHLHDTTAGVYGVVLATGPIWVDDPVYVE